MLYIILVVPLLVCWKNQVRCTSVARAYLGLFSFFLFFEKDWTTLLACFATAENEPRKVWITDLSDHICQIYLDCTSNVL